MFKIKFAFSVFVLLFMHQLVMLESAPANTNLATSSKIRAKRAFSMVPSDIQRSFEIFDYELHPDVEPHRCLIESAMMHIMLQSCVHFQPRETANYPQDIIFVKGDKCDAVLHDMGTWSNSTINLRDDCFNFGTILHQLMHVLGFEHEHQRSDRDQYLQINYDNIANSSIEQFNKELEKYRSIEHNYTEFDIDSITMYGPVGGSVDPERLKTIESKVPGRQVVGPGDKLGLSPLDVKSIKKVYRCSFPGMACRKLALFDNYITKCSVDARKYINLSLIKQLIDKCK